MKSVLFNDLICFRQRSGVGGYAFELRQALLKLESPPFKIKTLSNSFLFPPKAKAVSSAAKQTNERGKRILRDLGDWALGIGSRLGTWGLWHEPDLLAPPVKQKLVVTVHDLSLLRYPDWHPLSRVKRFEKNIKRVLRDTTHFIAVSEFTKKEMMTLMGIPDSKITVIHEAPRTSLRADQSKAKEQSYFLYVGNLEPRKNLITLISAFEKFSKEERLLCPMVWVGAWGWKADALREKWEQSPARDQIHIRGYLSDEELSILTQNATALIYPSSYEGFGLPPLEAMALGTPVIASNVSSMPEILGEAYLKFSPQDEETIYEAMVQIKEHREIREQYRELGFKQLKKYDWARAAKETMEVYGSVIGVDSHKLKRENTR